MNEPIDTGSKAGDGIRWWPVVVILSGTVAAVAFVRFFQDASFQQKNLRTVAIGLASGLLLILWILLLSRMRRLVRLAAFIGIVLLIGLFAALFRIRGVSGDMLPIVEWRFRNALPELAPATSKSPETAPGPRSATVAANAIPGLVDFPQFLGPDRNGVLRGPALARDWNIRPPELLWKQPVGAAWSGFAVVGDLAVTQEQRGELEAVVAYDLRTGKVRWVHTDTSRYATTIAGEGPRTTPTIVGGRVYAVGANGLLNCLELVSGRAQWAHNFIQELGGKVDDWGIACSPLVAGNRVIVSAGAKPDRSLAAYDAITGELAWSAGHDSASYSSPVQFSLSGVEQILIFNASGLAGHRLETGQLLWEYSWPKNHPHIAAPIRVGADRIVASSGYGTGSELLRVSADTNGTWQATRLWKSNRLKSKFANLIVRDGFLYGLDDGIMACLDLESGELKWKEGRYGHGQLILTGDLLFLMAENGDAVLIDPNPDGLRELTRFTVLRGKTWNPPALAGEYLVVRNDLEAACYRLPVEAKSGSSAPAE